MEGRRRPKPGGKKSERIKKSRIATLKKKWGEWLQYVRRHVGRTKKNGS